MDDPRCRHGQHGFGFGSCCWCYLDAEAWREAEDHLSSLGGPETVRRMLANYSRETGRDLSGIATPPTTP